MAQTAMERAFVKAGVVSGSARIRALVDDVLAQGVGFDKSCDALLSAVRDTDDVQLIWEFFAQHRMRAARDWLRTGSAVKRERNGGGLFRVEAQDDIAAAGTAADLRNDESHRMVAPAVPSNRAGNGVGAGHAKSETLMTGARPANPKPAVPRADTLAGMKAVGQFNRRWLTEQTDLGKVLGDCERNEVLALAGRRANEGQFLFRIGSRMTPQGKLSDQMTEGELSAIWRAVLRSNEL